MTDTATAGISPVVVRKDGASIAVLETDSAAFSWVLRHQGQSVAYAIRWGGYSMQPPEPWTGGEARGFHATAMQCLTRHDHPLSDRAQLTRENCGACVLQGYRPRGGWGDPATDADDAGPNYANWARVYVEARQSIPERWRAAFIRQLRTPDNLAYAEALARSVVTFGVVFAEGR